MIEFASHRMAVTMRALAFAAATIVIAAPLRSQTYPSSDDPRSNLGSGLHTAGISMHGMRLVAMAPKPVEFDSVSGLTFVNSDLAFRGNYVYQGNFAGFSIWDVSDPSHPVLASVYPCITSQGDPSIVGNLLFKIGRASCRERATCRAG